METVEKEDNKNTAFMSHLCDNYDEFDRDECSACNSTTCVHMGEHLEIRSIQASMT